MTTDKRGYYHKYNVSRVDGRDRPGGDRENARYFTLDYVHDSLARQALKAYADAARQVGLLVLADDLDQALREVPCSTS